MLQNPPCPRSQLLLVLIQIQGAKLKIGQRPLLPMIQDLAEELHAIEQETFDDGHSSEVTQESDLEQEDSKNSMTEDEEQ